MSLPFIVDETAAFFPLRFSVVRCVRSRSNYLRGPGAHLDCHLHIDNEFLISL